MKAWQVFLILGLSACLLFGWAVAYHYDQRAKRREEDDE